ncbi:hypothetical protein imdm_2012 [gamma proteobacterium IMCC2047]|nr:hypothetical protein imdm_2012 [gamma proteobacterium IMCC2047]
MPFDMSILLWLVWLNMLDPDTVFFSPVIAANNRWFFSLFDELAQSLNTPY